MKSIISMLVIATITTIVMTTMTAYGVLTPYQITTDQLNRLVSIDNGTTFIFKCPMFSDKDTFTIDMTTITSMEYFQNYERIACNDKSPMEDLQDLNNMFTNLK